MESAYRAIEAGNRAATAIAGIAAVAATLLMFTSYFIVRSQRAHELDQQQKLAEAAEKAEAANNAKSTFLFNMSHDIRTPMNAILGYADLARNHLHEPEKLGEYMDYIRVSGKQLLSIINNVLEFARIENNKVTLVETVVKAGEGLDSCMVMFKPNVEEKLLYANEAACIIWGCKDFDELSAFANGSFRGLVHPDDLNRVTHSICAQVASNERGLDNIDYRIIRKDGSVRWVDNYGHLLKNDNKRDLFYVFVADTTEKHQVAAET